MSRIAKMLISIPQGVEVNIKDDEVSVKGPKGNLTMALAKNIGLELSEKNGESVVGLSQDSFKHDNLAMAGTTSSLLKNMVIGVSSGFEKKLELVGVGYRAQLKGNSIDLTLGFSHPVLHKLPEGVKAEIPNNTTIVLSSIDKQKLGQVAAEIRAYRPPEPYKGKGIRYADEMIRRKDTKKK